MVAIGQRRSSAHFPNYSEPRKVSVGDVLINESDVYRVIRFSAPHQAVLEDLRTGAEVPMQQDVLAFMTALYPGAQVWAGEQLHRIVSTERDHITFMSGHLPGGMPALLYADTLAALRARAGITRETVPQDVALCPDIDFVPGEKVIAINDPALEIGTFSSASASLGGRIDYPDGRSVILELDQFRSCKPVSEESPAADAENGNGKVERMSEQKSDPKLSAHQIEEERQAYVAADEARRLARVVRRDAVKLALHDADVEWSSLAYDVNEERGGIVVKGIENRDALPDTLVILAEQDDAIIVGLKSEIEQALDAKADKVLDEVGVPDLAADEKLTDSKLNMTVIEPLNVPRSELGPLKPYTEIRTLVDTDRGDGFIDYRIGEGWRVLSVQYALFPHPGSKAIEDATHVRYITLKRGD